MAVRFGEQDVTNFQWFDAWQSCTARQLATATGASPANTRRRLGQYVGAKIATVSPPIAGATGRFEREYYITPGNRKRLAAIAPWIDLSAPARRRKVASVPHHRLTNDWHAAFHAALQSQDYYSYKLFPYYRYDGTDLEAPTTIRALNRRNKTPADKAVIADFALVVSCADGRSSLAYGELDVGTEILDSSLRRRSSLLTKLETCAAFHDADGHQRLARRLGKEFSGFRVLITTSSQRRLANIRRLCERIGSSGFVWLTTFDSMSPTAILGPVWQTGEDPTLRPLLRHYGRLHQ